MRVKTRTIAVGVGYGIGQAIMELDVMTDEFTASCQVISISGIAFVPVASNHGASLLTRTVTYEDDELRVS